MGVRSPGQTDDQFLALDHAAVNLAGGAADIHSYIVPCDGYVIAWGYQVTTTINGAATAPVISLDTADYDGAANRTEQDSATIAHGTAAANAVTWRNLNYGNGVAVTAGQTIILEHKTVATTAGGARVFVVFRPSS